MPTKIFVNLPVKDLERSAEFFSRLGFRFDGRCTDETAAGMIVSDDIYVMLLTEAKFRPFTPHGISDTRKGNEVLVALSLDSREQVDALVRKAVAAGGTTFREPEDHGFMYGHAFQDLDGHVWEPFHMDWSAMPQEAAVAQ